METNRNVQRLRSLRINPVPLGTIPLTELLGYREHVLTAYETVSTDLSLLDSELARRTPILECGD